MSLCAHRMEETAFWKPCSNCPCGREVAEAQIAEAQAADAEAVAGGDLS